MGKVPYLHPTHRNLKTEQIGPSSHKNEYRTGVLVGNWLEERLPKIDPSPGPWPQPTSRGEFGPKTTAPRHLIRAPDAGRDLLFGHSSSLHSSGSATPTPTLNPINRQIPRFQQKRKDWAVDRDPDTHYMKTTKKVEMDMVGEMVIRDKQVLHDAAVKTGASFVKTFVQDHRHMSLRVYPKKE
jgi:hypothetical protein